MVAGSLGVTLGYPILDPLVGLGITVAILFIVKDSAVSMWRRMMDAVEPEIVDSIREAAAVVPNVEGVRSVRARWVGHRVHGEVAVRMDGAMSVAEASRVEEEVRDSAARAVPKLERLVVEVAAC